MYLLRILYVLLIYFSFVCFAFIWFQNLQIQFQYICLCRNGYFDLVDILANASTVNTPDEPYKLTPLHYVAKSQDSK